MNYIIVSYATKGGYEVEMRNLKASLVKFKIPHELQIIDSLGSWRQNGYYKPEFIKSMLRKHDIPVIWVDADATLEKSPDRFSSMCCDFAYHLFRGYQLAGGTLYFGNSSKAHKLLDVWIENNKVFPKIDDQDNLFMALGVCQYDLLKQELPPEYCWIEDLSAIYYNKTDPVIMHHQASRRLMVEENETANQKNLYSGLWKSGYTQSACALPLANWLLENWDQQDPILEIGCGNGKTAYVLLNYGFLYKGIDISLSGLKRTFSGRSDLVGKYFVEIPVWRMPFSNATYGLTFSTDVLEHIPCHMIEQTIREIYRVTSKKTFHVIATFPDNRDGIDLHPIVKPISWWREMFEKLNVNGIETELIDRKDFLAMMMPQ